MAGRTLLGGDPGLLRVGEHAARDRARLPGTLRLAGPGRDNRNHEHLFAAGRLLDPPAASLNGLPNRPTRHRPSGRSIQLSSCPRIPSRQSADALPGLCTPCHDGCHECSNCRREGDSSHGSRLHPRCFATVHGSRNHSELIARRAPAYSSSPGKERPGEKSLMYMPTVAITTCPALSELSSA